MTLRLIHTSDWHLGHVLHDIDQAPEQRAFLTWLADLCEREGAHGLLVSGDVFDVSNPPAAAVKLLAGFLADVWHRLPKLQVVVIGGNHDSAHRLETTEPFLRALGRLHVVGAVPRKDGAIDLDRALIRVTGEGDSALVAAIPFLRAADLKAEELGADPALPVRRIHQELFQAARERLAPNEGLVAMGHLFVAGGLSGKSERTLVGGVGAVPTDAFPVEVAYAALGHLHRRQSLAGRIHYSGTPYPLSFDEAAQEQQVNVVELAAGRLVEVRGVPTPKSRPLLRIPADGRASLPAVVEQLGQLPAAVAGAAEDGRPLLEVHLLLDRPEPMLRPALDTALAGKAARLVAWDTEYATQGGALGDVHAGKALDDLDPVEVFRQRWAKHSKEEPPAALMALFDDVLAEARREVEPGAAAGVTP